ncbi:hypothetical protein [Geothrix sp. 21YS21S-4]|uniref:hypothetical protein n=1 Tax=Geothrix sp. 21YS21S-4 TaxID=3068889 RepID=UPI0027B97300|nr:hypothetical protein [Geothrix sp. 21YS21S-4]
MALAQPSPKLQALLKDFQQIASMSGYLNHSFDPPQLRLFFTLYGRVMLVSSAEGLALAPRLQAWCEDVSLRLREGSSSAIMPPQIQVSAPQVLPDGRDYLVATLTFNTKVTETSYLRVRTAVLAAYQEAVKMREAGFREGGRDPLAGSGSDPSPEDQETPAS